MLDNGFPFILQTEISSIYTDNSKGRKIHNVILAPNFDVVDQITEFLKSKGRVDYDGRPIFKLPCPELVEEMRKINEDIEIIPAHIWTPWFSLFGSMSGFNSV
ncbi:MAG: UvrD/REP helicase, partial [Microgenomates group bacterium GW2011_GWA2_37_6]